MALPLLSILLWSFSVAYVDKPLTKKSSGKIASKAPGMNPKDSVKYRQKVKRTAESLKEDAADEAWLKTGEFEIKAKFARSMRGKDIEVLVKDEVEVDFGPKMIFKLLVEYENKDYYLECDLPTGAEKIKGLAKPGDKLDVKVFSFGFSRNPIMSIQAAKIVKDGRLIYEMKIRKVNPNEKPAPFLFEVNKVRFNDGVITKAGSVVAGKRQIEVSANGYKFLLKINSKQVALSELASFKEGDKVSLRFVHEVKTGALTYTIADWVSISKEAKDYGVKNKQMFYRFYEKVSNEKSLYSAGGYAVINDDRGVISLFLTTMKNEAFLVKADTIKLERKADLVYAKNVVFNLPKDGSLIKSPYVKFNLKNGTYELLEAYDKF